jgi:phosphoribosylanthranilate isomerase
VLRIKICGITTPEDARLAVLAGADAIGLVFAESPRQVDVRQARRIVAALPPFVTPVGVFVNAGVASIKRTAAAVGLHAVQLHGDEEAEMISALAPLGVIRAVRVRDKGFVRRVRTLCETSKRRPAAILLDAFSLDRAGGTGRQFDWNLVVGAQQAGVLDDAPPIILAGGLTPANVGRAVRLVRPHAVDVSGGVEMIPGRKDADKVEQFIYAARRAFSNPGRGKRKTETTRR